MQSDTLVTGTKGRRCMDQRRRLVINGLKTARSFAPQLTEAQQLIKDPKLGF